MPNQAPFPTDYRGSGVLLSQLTADTERRTGVRAGLFRHSPAVAGGAGGSAPPQLSLLLETRTVVE